MCRPPRPHRTLALALIVAAAACSDGSSPTAPPAPDLPNVAGQWAGDATDTFDDSQTVEIDLVQNGASLTGTISSQIFRTLESFPVTGVVDEAGTVRLTVAAADRGGCFDITAEIVLSGSRRRLSGTYVIDRKAEGCGRRAVVPPRRPFNVGRGRTSRG